jgi:hypothetical protein
MQNTVQLESHFSVGGPGEEEDARVGVPQPTVASTAQGAQVSSLLQYSTANTVWCSVC